MGKFYHATFNVYRESIERSGLLPGCKKNWANCADGYIYLSDDIEAAISFCEAAEDTPEDVYASGICCFEVDAHYIDNKKLFADPNVIRGPEDKNQCFAYAATIPTEVLSLVV